MFKAQWLLEELFQVPDFTLAAILGHLLRSGSRKVQALKDSVQALKDYAQALKD